jgi:hypothetical protein
VPLDTRSRKWTDCNRSSRKTVSAHRRRVDRNRRGHILCRMRSPQALCATLGLIGHAVASTPPLDIRYARTSFSPAPGSPALARGSGQTSDGFLWLGTPAGFYRFDGVRFEQVEAVGTVPLLGEFITALRAVVSRNKGENGSSRSSGLTKIIIQHFLPSSAPVSKPTAPNEVARGESWAATARPL